MRFSVIVILAFVFFSIYSCSKNGAEVTEEQQLEDSLTAPDTMKLVRVWPKGWSRLFSNKKEIKDSMYAATFMYPAIVVHDEHFMPPSRLFIYSKDSLGLKFDDQTGKFGIHKSDSVYKLHSQYAYPEYNLAKDSAMIELVPFGEPGKFRSVFTGYGNNKEFKIAVFAFRHFRYTNASNTHSLQRMSTAYSMLREDFINTLTEKDTFGIQEYEMVFK